ncbi:hypothetical protein OIU74_027041 [Salix koriyanagi]|uniref:Uncharacterized protein n=1 Tax=Salix koriyanagi TaxID=2511006 RepID=A0A9Q0W096_9ROSI|nr:hypothetical protein OIU74_027041 [Salix koriyanagi]
MADDGAEVEKKNLSSKTPKPGGGGIVLALKKKPDLPSKIPKPKSKSVSAAFGGRCIVLALRKLNREGNVKKKKKAGWWRRIKEASEGEEGNVKKKKKKKKRILNEKWEEGSDDLPEDVKEGSEDVKEGSDDLPENVKEGAFCKDFINGGNNYFSSS